jgi:hypothetical protein
MVTRNPVGLRDGGLLQRFNLLKRRAYLGWRLPPVRLYVAANPVGGWHFGEIPT